MTGTRVIATAFVVSIVASVALVVVYVSGGDAQLEGVLLGLALGGLGLGISLWATDLMSGPDEVEERVPLSPSEGERDDAQDAASAEGLTRRSLLVRLGGAAAAALGGALAIPTLSLGPRPGDDLFRTRWNNGDAVVDADGRRIKPGDLVAESVTTVFPDGSVGEGDSAALLVRVDPARLELPSGRAGWAPEGCLAYSKICTHAGCPVGLYRAEAHELLCPCHHSPFDFLTGPEPLFGPAARALPQLPLRLDDDGYLVAGGDFSEPVGPSFWNMTR